MLWTQPKKTIQNILVTLGILSLSIFILSLLTLCLWIFFPKSIIQLDKKIPNIHTQKIDNIMTQLKKEKDSNKKHQQYIKLYHATKDLTQLQQANQYQKVANEYLIRYHLKHNNIKTALTIVKKWMAINPNNFYAKYAYIDVLKKIDLKKAKAYAKQLYETYNVIDLVKKNYLKFLISCGEINTALSIEKKLEQTQAPVPAQFHLFYLDDTHTQFNQKQVLPLEYTMSDHQTYHITLQHHFSSLKALRLDIDGFNIGSQIQDIAIKIYTPTQTYENLDFRPMNALTQYEYLTISGSDAYGEIILPDTLKGKEILQIEITLKVINKIKYIHTLLLKNHEWKFFYNTGNGFNEQESMPLSLEKKGDIFISDLTLNHKKVQAIRVDIPSIPNMTLHDLKVIINKSDTLKTHMITKLHNLEYKDTAFTVLGDDPYFVIEFENPIDIHLIHIMTRF